MQGNKANHLSFSNALIHEYFQMKSNSRLGNRSARPLHHCPTKMQSPDLYAKSSTGLS